MEVGPKTFIRQDHEKVLVGPLKMVVVPPRHYCIIENPVVVDSKGQPVFDEHQQIKLRHADREVRLAQDPFPLFPGENLVNQPQALTIVKSNTALRLRAVRDFEETVGDAVEKHIAGDEWLFTGPGTYIPNVSAEVVETVVATVIAPNQALRLRARQDCISRIDNVKRVAGEEWTVAHSGAYLPGVYEEVVDLVEAIVLSDTSALHLKALRTFTDRYGKVRKNGEEWLVTNKEAEAHTPSVYEKVVEQVAITTLTNRQYCIVTDPVDEKGNNLLGQKRLIKGDCSFFLRPGEGLLKGIQDVFVLNEDEALVLRATEEFEDKEDSKTVARRPGDRWMLVGPREYIPAVSVEVVDRRKSIALDENEGIYVRDMKSGKVRAVCGQTYMLRENEELWSKGARYFLLPFLCS